MVAIERSWGWAGTRLKNVATINGRSLGNETSKDYTFRYLEISNVSGRGIISEEAIAETPFEDAPSRARRVVQDGDTVISSVRPNLQAAAYIGKAGRDFVASTGFFVVSPLRHKLDQKFTYYVLVADATRQCFEAAAKGVGYPAVDDKDFGSLKFHLPSLAEQKRIAFYLDKACAAIDGAIREKRQQLEVLDHLRKSIIHKAVTRGLGEDVELKDSGVEWIGDLPKHWKTEKLKRLLSEPLMYGTNEAAELDDPDLPRYIRITDFDDGGRLRADTFRSLPLEKAEGYKLSEGDLLFARSGATVGKSFLFTEYAGVACFAGYLIRARTDYRYMLPKYLYYYTKSPIYEAWKEQIFTQSTIQNISATKYAYLPVVLPPISEQQQIINFLDVKHLDLNRLVRNLNAQVDFLEQYRKSLIHECVTGKRRIEGTDLATG